ncbi:MAG: adenosylhomocysteine nucleosidase [Epulopiscium sp.]|jgi:adenosylhomocysteine nucleosidase|uniref:adenosylhomocysteine nucleosidase n=1 Tax=Defluviitalea raffinosedens TaxID=1450156 RepID=A0A7C8HGR0_9FIRM|nr:5'-methylthioadenosine/adenosylhomocysteine nucleosidase [Defluviitalea raffinosedens]MBZ4666886.1 nucleosidase [Defluviitaleaceae bacterium]MDK2786937.1 adenosylhomocysteine nucleosidase [Candidatus Epulonipiscium sp.]KAE9636109.1 5'-methylthioadenosine/adenosylhomocysteine nucleosidase [Defluviitalea raffinosedens]MBM7685043.1 adenosylhomocysteine nucleosidase [Defluviitalea raffinosedens]HHW67493.1 5'-methylthioadenosine/adenosylhomocysteine nucleosidase [Candidatus Epulonipiscium sp.]
MSKIGIIGAMEEEVTILRNQMQNKELKQIAGMDFYQGTLEGKEVILVRCGIGKVNAAICTQALIDHFHAQYIINTGVAGAIYEKLDIGDIVISSDCVQHDFDTSVFGDPLGTIPRMDESFFKGDSKLIELASQCAKNLPSKPNVYVGRVASGDQFISSLKQKQTIWDNFNAYCAEMEGAAIAHACYLNKIPFVIIRSISDKADHSADVNFQEFVKEAAKNSNEMILEILKSI